MALKQEQCELLFELADFEVDIGAHEETVGTGHLMLGDSVSGVSTTTVHSVA